MNWYDEMNLRKIGTVNGKDYLVTLWNLDEDGESNFTPEFTLEEIGKDDFSSVILIEKDCGGYFDGNLYYSLSNQAEFFEMTDDDLKEILIDLEEIADDE